MVKNLPANAENVDSIPDPGRPPHTSRQLSLCIIATEPVLCSPRAAATEARVP